MNTDTLANSADNIALPEPPALVVPTPENVPEPPKAYETDKAFERAINTFIGSTQKSMESANTCAIMALQHFADHGQVAYIQRFDDELGKPGLKNYVRQAAFRKWLSLHAPLTMVQGKYKKDTSSNATELDLKGAFAKPFWERVPNPEQFTFDVDNIVVGLNRVLHRFHSEKAHPANAEATALLKRVEDALKPILPEKAEESA